MKAIIYARVSSTTDRQNADRQISDLMNYARYENLDVIKIFEERISGAKKNCDRQILMDALEFSSKERIDIILVSELSRLGRNAFEVLETVKLLVDKKINLYIQKERFLLLDEKNNPTMFAPVMLATLSTCAQLERENIQYRLNSGRKLYIERGGILGRKKGSCKSTEQKKEEYKEVIRMLKQQYSLRNIAKLTGYSLSTIQRIKKEFI